MNIKLLITSLLCFIVIGLRAQSVVSVGCTAAPCFACTSGLSGTWSSSNTSVATVDATTGYITGVSIGTAIVSFDYTVSGCGVGNFQTTVNVVPMFSINAVSETAPLALPGEKAYTYCETGGLTLSVNVHPAITGATYTWDDGTTSTTVTTPTFTPSYTPGGSAVIHAYTVTVAQGSCVQTVTTNVVVPPAGCSPCDYYNVNAYRTLDGLTPISTGICPDCSTLQPFHTIIDDTLKSTNTADNNSYYVVRTAYMAKPHFVSDNFFMNSHVSLQVLNGDVDLVRCHLFSANTCPWDGIDVTASATAAGAVLLQDCLVENVGDYLAGINMTATGNYYSPTMPPIVTSSTTTYNSNYGGISLAGYAPSLSVVGAATPLPFYITDNVFTLRDMASGTSGTTFAASYYPFNWPSVSTMKAITTPSTMDPGFGIDACSNASVTSGFGQYGILLTGVGSHSVIAAGSSTVPTTYEYNYVKVGSDVADPSTGNANLFDNIGFGVQLLNSSAQFFDNTYRHLSQSGVYYAYAYTQGINDVQVVGVPGDNTNNRFYNCGMGVSCNNGCPYDFTCMNTRMSATTMASGEAVYMQIPGIGLTNHYEVSNNDIYNIVNGINFQWVAPVISGTGTSGPDGRMNIAYNSIVGITPAVGTEHTEYGIYIDDLGDSYSSAQSGIVTVTGNTIQGVDYGIFGVTIGQALKITDNNINLAQYSLGTTIGAQVGIGCHYSRYLSTVSNNIIGGFGYDCYSPPSATYGIFIDSCGDPGTPATISCNAVHDFNVGFSYSFTNHVAWSNNQMMRDKIGLELKNHASIGTQGSPCNPSDNHWDAGTCSICTTTCSTWPAAGWADATVSQTYVGAGVDVSLSTLYIRTSPTEYDPTNNDAAATATPYSSSTLLDAVSGSCPTLPPPSGCASYSGFRPAPASTDKNVRAGMDNNFSINPNPSDGNIVITRNVVSAGPVKVSVYNNLGQRVYDQVLKFENGRENITLKNVVPGTYHVKVSDGKTDMPAKMILIERN